MIESELPGVMTPIYHIHAYVCGQDCIQFGWTSEWVNITQVFNHRPGDCRWGVTTRPDGIIVVWDFHTEPFLKGEPWRALGEVSPQDDVDAAILHLVLDYDRAR